VRLMLLDRPSQSLWNAGIQAASNAIGARSPLPASPVDRSRVSKNAARTCGVRCNVQSTSALVQAACRATRMFHIAATSSTRPASTTPGLPQPDAHRGLPEDRDD